MLQAFLFSGARRATLPTLLAALCACLLPGCTPERTTPVTLLLGWDASESARDLRPRLLRLGMRSVLDLNPDRDHLTMFRLDRSAHEFHDGHPPVSREELQPLLLQELNRPASGRGTHPARFWHAAAQALPRTSHPTAILLLTDGGNEDRSAATHASLQATLRQLAASPRLLHVAVWGVRPELRQQLREDLAPFGSRLELRGLDDVDPDSLAKRFNQPSGQPAHTR